MSIRIVSDGDPLRDDSVSWDNHDAPCLECGAVVGQVCEDQCPAAAAAEVAAEEQHVAGIDWACCASPAAARDSLCGCGGRVA